MPDDPPTIPPVTDEEIDAVLYEAKGDAREAIRALLHDIAVLAHDASRNVSAGYVRGLVHWSRAG